MATIVDGYESKWVYAGDKYVAIASGHDINNWDEIVANARLIAAAPDLLEALLRVSELYPGGLYPIQTDIIVQAAIAKATGQ